MHQRQWDNRTGDFTEPRPAYVTKWGCGCDRITFLNPNGPAGASLADMAAQRHCPKCRAKGRR